MADLVESLLTLARADEGRFDLHREPVELEPLVREVVGDREHPRRGRPACTRLGAALQPVSVLGDRVRLRQLFLNLVTNAIKYSQKGGRVDLTLEPADGTRGRSP